MDNITIPIELDTFQSISHLLLAIIGIPLNLLIVLVILTNRRLNQKPRNVLWLGVIFSNLFTLLTILTELLTYHYQSLIGCKIFGSVTGVAYTCLLYNLLLSLMDRYVAIVHPLHHRRRVTISRILTAQILGAVLIFAVIKCPFLWIPVQCGLVVIHAQIIIVVSMILLVSCLSAQVIVYSKMRHLFRSERVLSVSFVKGTGDGDDVVVVGATLPSSNQLTVHHGGSRDMELQATASLLAGVFSLLVFTAPTLLNGVLEWVCRLIYKDDSENQCASIRAITPYSREVLLYHLVYHPILYVWCSKEFLSTIKEKYFRSGSRSNNPQPQGSQQ